MRDRRFIAQHRGGPLPRACHRSLALWAADCAEDVIGLFETQTQDGRPRQALAIARAWAEGQVKTGVAMKAAVAAHAAARSVTDAAAIAAARACGHAVATAHAADHSMGALLYAMKALDAAGIDSQAAFHHQIERLPPHLRDQVATGVLSRVKKISPPPSREMQWPAEKR